MLLCLAAGMSVHARGGQRYGWMALAGSNAVGLWFSASRSAIAAVAIVMLLATTWFLTARWNMRSRVVAIAMLLILGAAGSLVRARLLERDPTFRGGGFRQQFNATSMRMIAARPLAGVGVGRYYATSALFMSPQIAWAYGFENAHNNFLQIGAELGLPGLILFLVWIGTATAALLRAIVRQSDARLLGAAAGAIAFLATCLTGHPLLIHEVAFPFWMYVGLALGLAESARMNAAVLVEAPPNGRARSTWTIATGVAGAILLATVATMARGPVAPPPSQAVDGLYPWETAGDGRRFRWTEGYASLFIPADVKTVYIPVRVANDRPPIVPMGVEVGRAAVVQSRTLVDGSWTYLVVNLPDIWPPTPFKRVDLKVDRVWRPAVYIPGSADLRAVGIQVGEPELAR
jgi:hypothetical protein